MTRNILNEGRIFINTLNGGDAINISSTNSTSANCNLKISKQTANTTIANTDLFVLETAAGDIKKITGANMKSELEQSTVVSPLLLTGNSISIKGLNGFTANKILKVNSAGDSIEYADDVDTNFWDETNNILRPFYTSSSVLVGGTNMNVNIFKFQVEGNSYLNGNLLVETDTNSNNRQLLINGSAEITGNSFFNTILLGTTTNTNNRKLIVVGDSEIQGDLYIKLNEKIISSNNTNDYLQFGDRTFINNYFSNVFTYGLSFGATADLTLSTGRTITRANDSNDKITFNSGNFTFGNTGIFNNSIQVKSTDTSNSGSVSFFEASANGNTNNIDLHCPLILSHDYNVYLPKITDTNITDVYVLSNKNVLGGTNINISNSTTDTITVNMDTTISGTITFSNTISGSISGNAGTATKIASITNSNIVQLTTSQVLTNKTLSTGTVYNGNTIAVGYGGTGLASYTSGDILYASGATTLSKLAKGSANTFLMSNGTIPFYSAGYSFQNPISTNGMNVSLEGLSGFGTNNQIISTNGSDALQYRTLTAGTNITIGATSSTITINSSENYWERDSNISSFDLKTTNTVDNIALTVPFATTNTFNTSSTFVSTSSIKSTLGLISGGGEYIKFIDYSSTKPLELKGIINTATQSTYHMVFKHDYTGTAYPLLKQDINGNLLLHWNNIGDRFTFKSDGNCLMNGIISPTTSNNECFLSFGSTDLTSTFHRSEFVKLTIKKNSSYAAGAENGFIELIESVASSSNTTRLYFNNAGSAYIYWDGTNLVATQNTFSGSDQRFKKNETLANTTELSNAFDNIDIYKYQYEEQYAIDKGADPNKYVYGFIAQNVKEQTDNLSSQFSSTGKGQGIYPNEKIDYDGDKLVVDNVLTINKTDMNLLLWGKIKEMDSIIKNQQVVINNLLSATTFANFKKM